MRWARMNSPEARTPRTPTSFGRRRPEPSLPTDTTDLAGTSWPSEITDPGGYADLRKFRPASFFPRAPANFVEASLKANPAAPRHNS